MGRPKLGGSSASGRKSTRKPVKAKLHNISRADCGMRNWTAIHRAKYDDERYHAKLADNRRAEASSSQAKCSSSSSGGGGAGGGTARRLASSGVSAIEAFSFGVGATAGVDGAQSGGALGGGGGGGGGDGRNC